MKTEFLLQTFFLFLILTIITAFIFKAVFEYKANTQKRDEQIKILKKIAEKLGVDSKDLE